ncbi:unnamed protein product [Cyberlindnera jadinii]|uniref:Rad60/SUMO-like domain-containing protein n=1 Tax=Cyberlindnera jadinii (strain ATCC 18201 / CBS 1600 / BCRC 20928 / JCM 3617 / NBRC 0987 / NRRL Y-1542) TaxID=983966 RepID=A0A0H5CJ92_CYBJN|nr:unnamed protein product [Cyberlindnera jadinii]
MNEAVEPTVAENGSSEAIDLTQTPPGVAGSVIAEAVDAAMTAADSATGAVSTNVTCSNIGAITPGGESGVQTQLERQDTLALTQPDEVPSQMGALDSNVKTESTSMGAVDSNVSAKTTSVETYAIDIDDDDFFNLSVRPSFVEKPKKRKKKKKRQREDVTSATPDADDLRKRTSLSPSPVIASSKKSSITTDDKGDEDVLIVEEIQTAKPAKKPKVVLDPNFDENAIRQRIKEQTALLYAQSNDIYGDILDDNDEDDISRRLRLTEKKASELLSQREPGSAIERSISVEPVEKRKYNVTVESFIPGSEHYQLTLAVKGHKNCAALISKSVTSFAAFNAVPESLIYLYDPVNVTLMKDKIELKEHMKLDSLKLPVPESGITDVHLSLYTKLQARAILENEQRERDKRLRQLEREEELDRFAHAKINDDAYETYADDDEFRDIDKEIDMESATNEGMVHLEPGPAENEQDSAYFKIVLKCDEKTRMEVKVKPDTELSRIAEHYLAKSGLPSTTKIRLVFDDEDLNLNETVGDTELEEGFTVDVYH